MAKVCTVNRRRGFTLMELLIVVAIISVLIVAGAKYLPTYLMNARETGAMAQMRNIHLAQTQYNSQFGRYAKTLEELGPPESGQMGPSGAALISGDMATEKVKSGFRFEMEGNEAGYEIRAMPTAFNGTGRRTFYSDQTQIIRQNWGPEPSDGNSEEIK